MLRSRAPLQRLASMLSGAIVLALLGNCTLTVSEVCESRFPEMERRFDDAFVALAPWGPTIWDERRRPASVPEMERLDREAWQRWAEERLVETQRFLDATSGGIEFKAARDALSRAAIDLVAFHGYAGSGRGDRMIETLGRIRESSQRARASGCAR